MKTRQGNKIIYNNIKMCDVLMCGAGMNMPAKDIEFGIYVSIILCADALYVCRALCFLQDILNG